MIVVLYYFILDDYMHNLLIIAKFYFEFVLLQILHVYDKITSTALHILHIKIANYKKGTWFLKSCNCNKIAFYIQGE